MLPLIPLLALSLPQLPDTDTLAYDLNTTPLLPQPGPEPRTLRRWGDRIYFSARSGAGRELWSTDGSAGGTAQVVDLYPGAMGAFDTDFIWDSPMEVLPDQSGLVFSAATPGAGVELWRCDGPNGPVVSLGDLNPGLADSEPEDLTAFQGELWFVADDGIHGRELWKTDGTPSGTQLAIDLLPGPEGFFSGPTTLRDGYLAVLGAQLILARRTSTLGLEMWATDGTPGGTQFLVDCGPGGFAPPTLLPHTHAVAGGRLFFGADVAFGDDGLWVTDGTPAGTQRLAIAKEVEWIVADGARVFAVTGSNTQRRLYVSDGTLSGTTLLAHPSFPISQPSTSPGIVHQGVLYFGAETENLPGGNLGTELCRSDGTFAGTVLEKDIQPGSSSSQPAEFQLFDGKLYMVARSPGAPAKELSRYDFGTQTLELIASFAQNPVGVQFGEYTNWGAPAPFVELGGALHFPLTEGDDGAQLYQLTPTTIGPVYSAPPVNTVGSSPRELVRVGKHVFLAANGGGGAARELYVLDTLSGQPPSPAPGVPLDSEPTLLTPFRGGVACRLNMPSGDQLWWSDGVNAHALTPAAIHTIEDGFGVTGGRLYFAGHSAALGEELGYTEGAPLDGQLVDLSPGATDSKISRIGALDGRAVFRGNLSTNSFGPEVVFSDGTVAGTEVIDLSPGNPGSIPTTPIEAGGKLYFFANTPATGTELYVSDATAAGTQLVVELDPGLTSSNFGDMIALGDVILLTHRHPTDGNAVVVSDGTAAGTFALTPYSHFLDSIPLVPHEGRAYYTHSGTLDNQLRYVSPSEPGVNIVPVLGEVAGAPTLALPLETADLGEHRLGIELRSNSEGFELWALDTQALALQQVADSLPGTASSFPFDIVHAGGRVWFSAEAPMVGRELHALELGELGYAKAESLAAGCGAAAEGLGAQSAPRLGQPLTLELDSGLPFAPTALFFDTELGALGVPGTCQFQLPTPLTLANAGSDVLGLATYALNVPANPAFLGVPFYFRGIVVGPGQPFLGAASFSNTLEVVPGL